MTADKTTPDSAPDPLPDDLAELADIAEDSKLITWSWPLPLQWIKGTYLSTDMVAKGCEVTLQTVKRWIERGDLPAYEYPGGRVVVKITDLQDFLAPKLRQVTRPARVEAKGESQA